VGARPLAESAISFFKSLLLAGVLAAFCVEKAADVGVCLIENLLKPVGQPSGRIPNMRTTCCC
jgi:hypothetical protein